MRAPSIFSDLQSVGIHFALQSNSGLRELTNVDGRFIYTTELSLAQEKSDYGNQFSSRQRGIGKLYRQDAVLVPTAVVRLGEDSYAILLHTHTDKAFLRTMCTHLHLKYKLGACPAAQATLP